MSHLLLARRGKTDTEFQNDCLALTLFDNLIQSKQGINHWIPFTEEQVGAKDNFKSNFMSDFLKGEIGPSVKEEEPLFKEGTKKGQKRDPLKFSTEAIAVFNAGMELWTYYHSKSKRNINASLYDIREYFRGRHENDRMKSKSEDATFNRLDIALQSNMATLAQKIVPKVYEYGFLKD